MYAPALIKKYFPRNQNGYFHMFVLGVSLIYVFAYIYYWMWPHFPNLWAAPDWMGWADQPWYMKSAAALWALNFSPAQHYFPIGYQILAIVPVRILGPHGYGVVNFVLVVGAAALLYKTFLQLVPAAWAAAAIAASLILPMSMLLALVTPATNIAVLTYVSAITFLYLRETWTRRDLALIGVFFGAIFITRPGDVVYVLPIAIAVAVELVIRQRNLKNLFLFVCCGLAAAALWPLSNKLIYGQMLSPYAVSGTALSVGNFTGFGAKVFSMLFNGVPVYLTESAMMVKRFPWLVLWPCGVWLLIRDRCWRHLVVQGSAVLGFVYFCSFAPLTPTVLEFFNTIRAFVPVMPLLVLPAALALYNLLTKRDLRSWAWVAGALVFTVVSMTGVIGYRQIEVAAVSRTISDDTSDVVIIAPTKGKPVRHIVLPSYIGTMGDFNKYHQLVKIDTDTTCLESQFDQWTFPLKPVLAVIANAERDHREIAITLPTNMRAGEALLPPVLGGVEACIFCGNSGLVVSAARQRAEAVLWIPRDNIQLDLAGREGAPYLGKGWQLPEANLYRWMSGHVVELTLPPVAGDREHVLTLDANTLASLTQAVQLFVNGKPMGSVTFNGKGFQTLSFRLPKGALSLDGRNLFEFHLPNAVSPKSVGLTPDSRLLSIAVRSIVLSLDGVAFSPVYNGAKYSLAGTRPSVMGSGWSDTEATHTFTDGPRAELNLPKLPAGRDLILTLDSNSVFGSRQRVIVSVNGKAAAEMALANLSWHADLVTIPEHLLSHDGPNHIVFKFPDALTPAKISGGGGDQRLLALAVREISCRLSVPGMRSLSFAEGGDLVAGPDWARSADAFVSVAQAGHIRFTQKGRPSQSLQVLASVEPIFAKAGQPVDVDVLVNGYSVGMWHFGCAGRTVRDVVVPERTLITGVNDIEIHTITTGARLHLRRLTVQPQQ